MGKRTYALDPDTTYQATVGDHEVTVKGESSYETAKEDEQTMLEVTYGFKPKGKA